MSYNSKKVESNQEGVHQDLLQVLEKYRLTEFAKPYSKHTLDIYHETFKNANNENIILDLGCGTGESTIELGKMFPNYQVIGIDKSENRIEKQKHKLENVKIIRADFIDFVRLMVNDEKKSSLTCLFYPNPWPKKDHLKRRIHAHPFFPYLLKVSEAITMRTNWDILASEMEVVIEYFTKEPITSRVIEMENKIPLTNFERKYTISGHKIWETNWRTDFEQIRLERGNS